jgi:hypothetical protein
MTTTAKIGKKDIYDINRQIILLARECKKVELPRAKRYNRNGCGLPLTGWMASVKKGSKILAVADCKAQFAYRTYNAASQVIAERIAKKKPITSIQYMLVYEYVQSRYRGGRDGYPYIPPEVIDLERSMHKHELVDLLRAEFPRLELPLNFLLSQRLTDLILLKTLFETVRGK